MSRIGRALISSFDSTLMRGEFNLYLPLLARLPLRLGYPLAALRGTLNWMLDREWRSISLKLRYIRTATDQAMKQLFPDLTPAETRKLTRLRFAGNSREEFEAYLLIHDRARELSFTIRGLESLQAQLDSGKGVVLLTPHFDSFILGISSLGMSGLVVNVMTSDVVEHSLVDDCVRRFFSMKYRSLERYLNGGKAVHVERDLGFFYRALLNGECVVVLADLPPAGDKDQRIWIPFLGREVAFLSGAYRLARRTGSAIAGFTCHWEGKNRYEVTLSECVPPEKVDEGSYRQIYHFLSAAILRKPERWWAADLMRTFEAR